MGLTKQAKFLIRKQNFKLSPNELHFLKQFKTNKPQTFQQIQFFLDIYNRYVESTINHIEKETADLKLFAKLGNEPE